MHDIFGEYKIHFLEEAEEYLESLNGDLIAFEKDPSDRRLINNLFRIMHTLKSSAAAVGMDAFSEFAHDAEDLIQQFRSGSIKVDKDIIDILFAVFDEMKSCITLAWEEREAEVDFTSLTNRMHNLYKKKGKGKTDSSPTNTELIQEETFLLSSKEKSLIQKEKNQPFLIHVQIDSAEPIKWLRAELILNHMMGKGKIIRIIPEKSQFQSNQFAGHFSVVLTSSSKPPAIEKAITIDLVKLIRIEPIKDINLPIEHHVKHILVKPDAKQEKIQQSVSNSQVKQINSENSIRVSIQKLDELMHLVGELVITNSALKFLEKRLNDRMQHDPLIHEMNILNDKLIRTSADLQRGVLKTRMLPVDMIFNQYKRVVRDLSKKEKKEIDLIIKGKETEVDKKVIDILHDPLTHLIRNAVDHGIETPAERIKKNKPPRAHIELIAEQSGNHILITIKDNGRGIDLESVKNKAIQKGIINRSQAQSITENELLNTLFQPGFSTSEKVSSMSGRGVGLDVVNNAVKELNGTVHVQTQVGLGTEFLIVLPLTLSIITVIVVESNKHRYGIPVNDIRETIKIPEKEIENRECVRAVKLDDQIIPVIGLNDALENQHNPLPKGKYGLIPIIIISYKDKEIGLIVDKILGKQEIVLKSLEKNYKSIQGLSGAAILGDGSVILVIDTIKVIQIYKETNKIFNAKTEEKTPSLTKLKD